MIIYGYRALSKFLKNIDNERLEKSDWDLLLTFEELNRLIDSLNGSATLIKPRGKDGYLIKTPIANYDIHLIIYENSNKYLYDNQSEYLSNKTLIDPYGNEYKVPSIKNISDGFINISQETEENCTLLEHFELLKYVALALNKKDELEEDIKNLISKYYDEYKQQNEEEETL